MLTGIAKEKTILVAALLVMGGGLMLLAASDIVVVLLAGVGLMAGCFNVAMPTAMGLVSRLSPAGEQGNVMGTTVSAISLAPLVGPVFATAVFSVSMRGNYVVASTAIALAALLSVRGVALPPHRAAEIRKSDA